MSPSTGQPLNPPQPPDKARRTLLGLAALGLAGCSGAQRAVGGRPAVPSWSRRVYTQPHGTIYWGGAGLDGSYVEGTLQALREAGVDNVSAGLVDTARRNFPQIGMFFDALRAGTSLREEDPGDWVLAQAPQASSGAFNLVGYSYGSLIAAQTAAYHARHGFAVDKVVLIGSPIGPGLLASLQTHSRIGRVLVVDLTEHGDPIRAGMPQGELTQATPLLVRQMLAQRGEGHFHYAVEGATGRQRWAALAARLRDAGLR